MASARRPRSPAFAWPRYRGVEPRLLGRHECMRRDMEAGLAALGEELRSRFRVSEIIGDVEAPRGRQPGALGEHARRIAEALDVLGCSADAKTVIAYLERHERYRVTSRNERLIIVKPNDEGEVMFDATAKAIQRERHRRRRGR